MKLILASGSPRRRDLLSSACVAYDVIPAGLDERAAREGEAPADYALALALEKAESVAAFRSDGPVLGADTVVTIDGHNLGKPTSVGDAQRMLQMLRGREHTVVTGVALVTDGARWSVAVEARVRMRHFSDDDLACYIETGEPFDKAGAYAVQGHGGVLVERVDGCYLTVVGLPLCRTVPMLRRANVLARTQSWCAYCPRVRATLETD